MRYDFPVSLQKTYTRDGREVPNIRAVVNEESWEPIAAVSTKYKLIKHDEVMNLANPFLEQFGANQVKTIDLSENGARMASVITLKDESFMAEIQKGDMVGLRIAIENGYNAKSSVRISIGAIQLVCLNGMMASKGVFESSFRHTTKTEVTFPSVDEILTMFHNSTKTWKSLAESDITREQTSFWLEDLSNKHVLPLKAQDTVIDHVKQQATAWGFYSGVTNFLTHKSQIHPINKINKLRQFDAWVQENIKVH